MLPFKAIDRQQQIICQGPRRDGKRTRYRIREKFGKDLGFRGIVVGDQSSVVWARGPADFFRTPLDLRVTYNRNGTLSGSMFLIDGFAQVDVSGSGMDWSGTMSSDSVQCSPVQCDVIGYRQAHSDRCDGLLMQEPAAAAILTLPLLLLPFLPGNVVR